MPTVGQFGELSYNRSMNLTLAVTFIQNNGNEVERARLAYVLAGEPSAAQVVASLFAGQRADGGWAPFWATDYSSLDAVCFRLAQAEQLGVTGAEPAVRRALQFLAQRQAATGVWEEDEKVADLAPPWARPGDLSARLYLTANCGLWLALWGNPDDGQTTKAARYLQTYLDEDGRLPGFAHTHWLAGGLWRKLGWVEPTARIFGYLGQQIDDLPTSNVSWLVTTLAATGVPAAHPLLRQAVHRLAHSQQEDGRWVSEDGPGQDVHATLEALRALSLCGHVVPTLSGGLQEMKRITDFAKDADLP